MYTIPKNFTGDFLLNKDIDCITFCKFQWSLSFFQDEAWIGVSGDFTHLSKPNFMKRRKVKQRVRHGFNMDAFPLKHSTLLSIIGFTITQIVILNETDLLLQISNGEQVIIKGNNNMYECYDMFDGKDTIYI